MGLTVANITLGYNNRIDLATLSGGSWSSTLPLVNVQSRVLSKAARSTDDAIASATINIDYGAAASYYIAVVALIAHNLSSAAKVRIRASTVSDFASTTYDSGWVNAWASGTIPSALLEWESDSFWLGTVSAQMRAGYAAPYVKLTTRVTSRYWRIEIDDTSNSDTWIQIGRLFMSDTWTAANNYNYGATLAHDDPAIIDTALDGTEFYGARSRRRSMKARLEWLSESEAYTKALDLQRIVGATGELIVIPDSADTTYGYQRNLYARLAELSPVSVLLPSRYGVDLDLRELL